MADKKIDIKSVLEQYKHIPWVERLFNYQKYPVITNPDGTVSSHKMSWGQYGDKYVVFPTIEYINGKLVHLPSQGIDPFDYAIKNRSYIEFDKPEQADYFSQHYKEPLGIK